MDNDENDFKRTKQEESINSPDSNENSITVHQPNRQNNSPRRNKCLPYHKMTLMYLCKMTHNPKKIFKIEKRPSQISLKQTKNDEISSNHNNIIQSHVLDDLHLPQQQLILKNDDILHVSEEVNDIIENKQVIKLPKKKKNELTTKRRYNNQSQNKIPLLFDDSKLFKGIFNYFKENGNIDKEISITSTSLCLNEIDSPTNLFFLMIIPSFIEVKTQKIHSFVSISII